MNSIGRFDKLINNILKPLKNNHLTSNGEVFRLLFILAFKKLKAAENGNPLIHHLIVLKHMIEISMRENLNILISGAIAILHDIAPVKKIRLADMQLEKNEKEKLLLDQKRYQHRTLHMQESSALARQKLLLLNEYLGLSFFKNVDIEKICEVISIHDNPSIDIPIPKEDHIAIAFREADRLWMLSDEGFSYDIKRDVKRSNEKENNILLASNRLNHVIKRFQEERKLYAEDDGPFQNELLFFRTNSGYKIYLKYLQDRKKQYSI